jgi:hypothetical protein
MRVDVYSTVIVDKQNHVFTDINNYSAVIIDVDDAVNLNDVNRTPLG